MRFNDVQDTSKVRNAHKTSHHKLTKEQVQNNFFKMIGSKHLEKPFMHFGAKFSA